MNIFVHSTLHWRKSLAPLNNPTVQNIMVIIVIIKIIIIVIKIIVLSSSSLSFSIIINSPDRQPLISSLLPNHQYCIREEGFIGKCIPRGRRDFPREIYFPMHPDSRQCTSILSSLAGKYWFCGVFFIWNLKDLSYIALACTKWALHHPKLS